MAVVAFVVGLAATAVTTASAVPPVVPPTTPPITPPAGPPEGESDGTLPDLTTPEAVAARIASLEGVETRDPAQQAELEALKKAVEQRRATAVLVDEIATYEALIAAAPARLAEIQAALSALENGSAAPESLPADETALVALESSVRTDLAAARTLRDDVAGRQAKRAERRQAIPNEKATAAVRLNEGIPEERTRLAASEAPAAVRQARTLALDAEAERLQRLAQKLDAESRMIESRRDIVTNELRLAEQQVLALERRLGPIEKRISEVRAAAAAAAARQADEAAQAAANDHAALQRLAAENQEFANRTRTIAEASQERRPVLDRVRDRVSRIEKDFEVAETQVETAGLGGAVGVSLRGRREQLLDERVLARALREVDREIGRMYALRASVGQRQAVSDTRAEAEFLIQTEGENRDVADEVLVDRVQAALQEQRQQYVDPLIVALDDYVNNVLTPLRTERSQLLVVTRDYADFLDQRILWVRSTDPMSLGDLRSSLDASRRYAQSSTWRVFTERITDRARQGLPFVVLSALAAIALVLVRRPLRRFAHDQIERGERFNDGTILHSITAVGALLARAATIPIVLFLVAAGFRSVGAGDPVSSPIAAGLARAAFALLASEFMRETCRPKGFCERHLKWRKETTRLVRRTLRWSVPLLLPLIFVIHGTSVPEAAGLRPGFGRIAYVGTAITLSLLAYMMLHPRRGVPAGALARHPGGWIDRLAFVWYPGLVALPLVLAGMSLAGWQATAVELQARFGETILLLIVVAMAHGTLKRGIVLGRRRLALAEARRRREEGATEDVSQVNVEAVGEQAASLLWIVTWATTLAGFVALWAPVLPALGIFGQVRLWSDVVPGTEEQIAITLLDIGQALLVVVVTVVLARNLPGLLSIFVLPRLPISPGGRYAIATILRYTVVVAGIAMSFNAIGIGWSKVQFLAAAVTVGLGFGLQEIFANFVSGLIILFERPIRVGDTVTVSGVSGTVSRIQMRATTITDWDRKELIIPNKTFVTGEVVNWSLSDSTLRIIVPVGVAYGSDTRLARRLLLEVAADCPTVLKDPPPRALFMGFGSSSLDLSLRCFIATPDNLLTTHDALHEAIDDAFHRHGIEIAFPQQDLHLRTIDDEFVDGLARSRRGGEVPALPPASGAAGEDPGTSASGNGSAASASEAADPARTAREAGAR